MIFTRSQSRAFIFLLIFPILLASLPTSHTTLTQAAEGAGYALSFGNPSGSNDFIEIIGTFPLQNQPRALSFWAKSSDGTYQGNADHMVNYGGASFNHAFGVMLRLGNTWWFYGHNDIDSNFVADTLWHYHAVSYDGSTASYYIDGVLFGREARNLDTFQSNLFVGIRPDKDFNNTFNGVIDEVRMWNRALSPPEIQVDMRSKPVASTDGLIGYWNFDEGSGQTVHDATSSNFNGILGSSASSDDNDPTWVVSDAPLNSSLWVKGKVTNSDNSPVAGVTITGGPQFSTMTGLDGEYALVNLSAGATTITPAKAGFVLSPPTRSVTTPPQQTNVNFTNITNQIVLPADGTVTVTHISYNSTCSGDFGLSSPQNTPIFNNYGAYSGGPYTITPSLAAGTELVFYAQQYCSGIKNLSTDPSHARVIRIDASTWRIGWEDWNDGDFNDLVVEVHYSSSNIDDEDGDAIPDYIEINGYDHNNDGEIDVNLAEMGASPRHKDVFVHVDWLESPNAAGHSHKMKPYTLETLVNAFADAPVQNPDGKPGIKLHISFGTGIPETSENEVLGEITVVEGKDEYDWDEFDLLKAQYFPPERTPIFHYAILAHHLPIAPNRQGRPIGVAKPMDERGAGSDFIVALYDVESGPGIIAGLYYPFHAGTFMHELGHNLGLDHGGVVLDEQGRPVGPDKTEFKPNHLSVMNYSFMTRGVLKGYASRFFRRTIDYSRFGSEDLSTLNESALSETQGFSASERMKSYGSTFICENTKATKRIFNLQEKIDWDCSGKADREGPFRSDINGDGRYEQLTSVNEWAALRFRAGAVGAFGFSPIFPRTSIIEELTAAEDAALGPYLPSYSVFLPLVVR